MTPAVLLGARLAAKAGRTRLPTVAGCTALGVFLLVMCMNYPAASKTPGVHQSPQDSATFQLLTGAVCLPVVVLVTTASRLSSDSRDRRLATLRLLGTSPRTTGLIASVETAAIVALGALGGLIAGALCLHPAMRSALQHGWVRQIPHMDWPVCVLACLGLIGFAAAAAARPAWRSGTNLLTTARPAPKVRMSWRAVALTAVCAAAGIIGMARPQTDSPQASDIWPTAVALFGCGIALVGAGATITELFARALRSHPSATATIAGRRMAADRRAISRSIGALAIATFVSAFGFNAFSAFTATPQYRAVVWAQHHATPATLSAQPSRTNALVDEVRAQPGARSVRPTWVFQSASADVLVMSCADLAHCGLPVSGCSDTTPWAAVPGDQPRSVPARVRLLDPINAHPLRSVSVPATGHYRLDVAQDLGWINPGNLIVIPTTVAATYGAPNGVLATVAPGSRLAWQLLINPPANAAGLTGATPDWDDYDNVTGYRRMMLMLVAAVTAVGALTVVVAVSDHLAERRRRVASLRIMGTPVGVLRVSQFVAMLVPLVVTVALAMGCGWIAGRSYLRYAGATAFTPTRDLSVLLVATLLAAVVLAAGTTLGLGRRLTPDLLRRE